MPAYTSIKSDIMSKLRQNLPEIQTRFGVKTIGIFGSVAREEDTENSDVDILFSFRDGEASLDHFLDLADYLENLFSKKVDLIPEDGVSPYMMPFIAQELVWAHA